MMSGEAYKPSDSSLSNDLVKAKQICHQLNQVCPSMRADRQALVNKLLNAVTDAWIESPFFCDYGYNIQVGSGFYANHGCTLLDGAPIVIGDNVFLAPGVVISTATHPIDPTLRATGEESAHAIRIGNNVWLGANVTVCPGVTIGDNVVVGAGSVVVKSLPENTVCVGSPAAPIREIETREAV